MPNAHTMPALFLGHGNPMLAIEPNHFADSWRQLGQQLPRPRAILMISAHWYARGTGVTAMAQPRTIHDFCGFPQALFEVQYPARGDPQLAKQIQQSLAPLPVALDQAWGLDHGCWAVLKHMYPAADIPVLQLSIDAGQPPAFHYLLGKQLAALRQQNVLLIGSGNVVHNLGMVEFGNDVPALPWAIEYELWVKLQIQQGNHAPLIDYLNSHLAAHLASPRPDHYLPLLYVLGAQLPGDVVSFPTEGIDLAAISMLSLLLTPQGQ